jgi:hypothetical protein
MGMEKESMYAVDKAIMEAVQRFPEEEKRAILTMLRGAIIISDMYANPEPQRPVA